MNPKEVVAAFDLFLSARGLQLEAIVVGGTALSLLGTISRQTRDCDVLHPVLSKEILEAAASFAAEFRGTGEVLVDDWLNNGPISLKQDLPSGWEDRTQLAYQGRALTLFVLGRMDMLRSKLYALCDRAFDLPDCVALGPTPEELAVITPWLEQRDANPDWPDHVRATLDDLRERLTGDV